MRRPACETHRRIGRARWADRSRWVPALPLKVGSNWHAIHVHTSPIWASVRRDRLYTCMSGCASSPENVRLAAQMPHREWAHLRTRTQTPTHTAPGNAHRSATTRQPILPVSRASSRVLFRDRTCTTPLCPRSHFNRLMLKSTLGCTSGGENHPAQSSQRVDTGQA